MKKQVIITGWQSRVLTALYENDLLYELWMESEDNQVRVGDVYIGKVKHIVPNIQAAFVEITPGVMGYYSLKENTEHLFVNPKKNDKVVAGDEIVVQIEKENLKTKAWNLSGKISFTGRYMILNAGRKGVQLSAKIKDEAQRESLSSIVTNSAYNDKGWLIRTEAKDVPVGTILEEMERLIVNYNKLMSTAKSRTCFTKLRSGDTFYLQTVRQAIKSDECVITTDHQAIYQQLLHLAEKWPETVTVKYYEDTSYPLVKLKGIEAQIDKALQKRVWMKSGAYLVIEPTEALTVVDVNTGKAIGKQNMEENFFKINMEAAHEVCRQMRLRNLSGIIIVDFINMKEASHIQQLMQCLREEAAKDAIQTTIVDRTALHLVEITRKKVRKTLFEQIQRKS